MERLGDDELRKCSEGGCIALVRVEQAWITAAGSKSEHVKAKLAVERVICGSPPSSLVAWSFTSKGDTLLATGHRYVVSLVPAGGYAPFGIGPFVEVASGRESEAVALHERALKALRSP